MTSSALNYKTEPGVALARSTRVGKKYEATNQTRINACCTGKCVEYSSNKFKFKSDQNRSNVRH